MKHDLTYQKRILIVDDSPAIRELLRCMLSIIGNYAISLTVCGADALTLIHISRPDLLLLDYQLPDMTGLCLYDILYMQSNLPPPPTILMSASLPYEELKTRQLIALEKPFRLTSVRIALHKVWKNHSTQES